MPRSSKRTDEELKAELLAMARRRVMLPPRRSELGIALDRFTLGRPDADPHLIYYAATRLELGHVGSKKGLSPTTRLEVEKHIREQIGHMMKTNAPENDPDCWHWVWVMGDGTVISGGAAAPNKGCVNEAATEVWSWKGGCNPKASVDGWVANDMQFIK